MVGVEVSVGVKVGVSVKVWVGTAEGEGLGVSVGCVVDEGIWEGEGETVGEITGPEVLAVDKTPVPFEVFTEALLIGKLQDIPIRIHTNPIALTFKPGFI
jgi:hypothetical protein